MYPADWWRGMVNRNRLANAFNQSGGSGPAL
jgi:hypothetical protein